MITECPPILIPAARGRARKLLGRRGPLTLLTLVVSTLLRVTIPNASGATEIDSRTQKFTVTATEAVLQFRLTEPGSEVANISAKLADNPVEKLTFKTLEEANKESAILFLVDRSIPVEKSLAADRIAASRAKSIEASKRVIQDCWQMLRKGQRMSVYAAGTQVLPITNWGRDYAELTNDLKNLRPEKAASDLYRSIADAIRVVQGYQGAEFRAVVVVSSGNTASTGYSFRQVIDEANKAGVVVFAVGYPDQAQDMPYLQVLNEVVYQTKGRYAQADTTTKALSEKFGSTIAETIRAGGLATVDITGAKGGETVEIEIHTKNGEVLKKDYKLPNPLPAGSQMEKKKEGEKEEKGNVEEKKKDGEGKGIDEEKKTAQTVLWWQTPWAIGVGAAMGLVLIGLILLLALRKPKPIYPDFYPPQPHGSDPFGPEHGGFGREGSGYQPTGTIEPFLNETTATVRQDEIGNGNDSPTRYIPPGGGSATVAAGRAYARLRVLEGDTVPEFLMRERTVKIGRYSDQDLILKNDSVSRAHAVISRQPDGTFLLTNLRPANFTCVNGAEVTKDCVLKHLDTIELGEVQLKFQVI